MGTGTLTVSLTILATTQGRVTDGVMTVV
jgi:hypothetical protein